MLQCIFHTPLLRGIIVEYGSKLKHHELNFIMAITSFHEGDLTGGFDCMALYRSAWVNCLILNVMFTHVRTVIYYKEARAHELAKHITRYLSLDTLCHSCSAIFCHFGNRVWIGFSKREWMLWFIFFNAQTLGELNSRNKVAYVLNPQNHKLNPPSHTTDDWNGFQHSLLYVCNGSSWCHSWVGTITGRKV